MLPTPHGFVVQGPEQKKAHTKHVKHALVKRAGCQPTLFLGFTDCEREVCKLSNDDDEIVEEETRI